MSDYPEPAAGPASAWTRVGGALVDRNDILRAISALSALPDSDTVIIKSLKDIGSEHAPAALYWPNDGNGSTASKPAPNRWGRWDERSKRSHQRSITA